MMADEWRIRNAQFWREIYVEFEMIKDEAVRQDATTTIYIEACKEQINPRASDPSSPEGFVPADKLGKADEKKPIPPSEGLLEHPDMRMCPDCHASIARKQSPSTGKYYYRCIKCNQFLNKDGTVPCQK